MQHRRPIPGPKHRLAPPSCAHCNPEDLLIRRRPHANRSRATAAIVRCRLGKHRMRGHAPRLRPLGVVLGAHERDQVPLLAGRVGRAADLRRCDAPPAFGALALDCSQVFCPLVLGAADEHVIDVRDHVPGMEGVAQPRRLKLAGAGTGGRTGAMEVTTRPTDE